MKVLVADDDAVSRRLLETYLLRWGHEVRMALNGAEAWALFQQDDFPLVLTDWTMPEMDGVELVRRIRASPQGALCHAILVSSKSQKEDLVEGMEAGADDFVTKPFDRDELRVRLRVGERTVLLERNLAAQNQALRAAQEALLQHEQLTQLGASSIALGREVAQRLVEVAHRLASLRNELAVSGETSRAMSAPLSARAAQSLDESIAQIECIVSLAQPLDAATAPGAPGAELKPPEPGD